MKYSKHSLFSIIAVVTLAIMLAQCSKEPQHYGEFTVKLTDSPAEYVAVNILVEQVDIHYAGNDSLSGHWLELPVEPTLLNLLELRDGIDTTLYTGTTPAGRITQIRLILSDASLVLSQNEAEPNDTVSLKVPSGMQSGLKIKLNEEISPAEDLTITLDFDAESSIVEKGNGEFSLKPVLKISKIEYITSSE